MSLSSDSLHLSSLESESESHSVLSNSLQPHGLYSPWNSLGQNTGVGSHYILQGIFPSQGSNPCLLHCRQILYQLSPQGSPRILEWVAYPFSRGSSWPRNWIGVFCNCRWIFYQLSYQSGPLAKMNAVKMEADACLCSLCIFLARCSQEETVETGSTTGSQAPTGPSVPTDGALSTSPSPCYVGH